MLQGCFAINHNIAAGMLVGNVLLAAAFASYAGPFDMGSRLRLVQDIWLPDLQQRAIPMTVAFMPLDVLTTNSIKVLTNGHIIVSFLSKLQALFLGNSPSRIHGKLLVHTMSLQCHITGSMILKLTAPCCYRQSGHKRGFQLMPLA